MASFTSLVASNSRPTAFGVFDDDLHFQEDAESIILYVKRRLGDDIMSVELTNKQIWTNFEEACLEFSKNVNAHQAESYMSNLLGLSTGHTESYKKNANGHYYFVRNGQVEDDVKDKDALIDVVKDKDALILVEMRSLWPQQPEGYHQQWHRNLQNRSVK